MHKGLLRVYNKPKTRTISWNTTHFSWNAGLTISLSVSFYESTFIVRDTKHSFYDQINEELFLCGEISVWITRYLVIIILMMTQRLEAFNHQTATKQQWKTQLYMRQTCKQIVKLAFDNNRYVLIFMRAATFV